MPTQSTEENISAVNTDKDEKEYDSDEMTGSEESNEYYDLPYNEMEYNNFFSQMLEDQGGANLDIHMKKLIEAISEIKNVLKEGIDIIKSSTEQNTKCINQLQKTVEYSISKNTEM